MDKAQTLHSFWNSFTIPAYDENTVPSSAQTASDGMYIAYETALGNFPDTVLSAASIYEINATSWAEIEAKATEISQYIGYGGVVKSFTDDDGTAGALWIKRGSPFSQRMAGDNDTTLRIYLNLEIDFLTTY